MKSWYPETRLNEKQLKYLYLLQNIWKVYDVEMNLVPYKLAPHQIYWHSQDIAILGSKAKDRVVVKSRNTSFTTSALISNLMSVPSYPNQILPFIRLNERRAYDLIEECKELIRNMTPVVKDGKYYPFNPNDVIMSRAGSITFPNKVEFRAMPASFASAETIRGMRIFGSAGILDESNFMISFKNLYIALRDSSRGSNVSGIKHFQMNIGTTRKGRSTPFNTWFEEILIKKPTNIQIFEWPVFNPSEVDLNKSLLEQPYLTPIVPWHVIRDLENKRLENLDAFKEEYMGILVDAASQFYEFYVIQKALELGEKLKTKQCEPEVGKRYYIGIDVASGVGRDYFVISIFSKEEDILIQKYLHYNNRLELPQMEQFCIDIIDKWSPIKVRIDSIGNGTQIAQSLQKIYGVNVIEAMKGGMTIKGVDRRIPLKLNEFAHTNLKKLMSESKVALLNDELQIKHLFAWDNNYKAESSEAGHGDIIIANMFACLPDDWKHSKQVQYKLTGTPLNSEPINEEKINTDIMQRVEWYKKQQKRRALY